MGRLASGAAGPRAGRITRPTICGLALAALFSSALVALAEPAEAPLGNEISAAITNYNRTTPFIGTSGAYDPSAVAEVKALGFKTTVDLRSQSEEGVTAVAEAVQAAGLKYFNIPVTTAAPTPEQVEEFAKIVENPDNYPILVNCHSANRVGAMWALYRAATGVRAEVAIGEARTVGLQPSREAAVRQQLGVPPKSE